ncbi:acyl carrier protein [Planctomicrobium sp. SH668]|uniref:acyl carrier protein n=1 Tax=Planctomicrobium sp. SH668 TaxID=3448126 RepID=UPI003F5BB6EE
MTVRSDEPDFQIQILEQRVCDVAARLLSFPREEVVPFSRLIEDLHFDSLSIVELLMVLEEEFSIGFPDPPFDPLYKSVFTRSPFRLSDLAELVYLQQGTTPSRLERRGGRRWRVQDSAAEIAKKTPFSQLNGIWQQPPSRMQGLLESLESVMDLSVGFEVVSVDEQAPDALPQ